MGRIEGEKMPLSTKNSKRIQVIASAAAAGFLAIGILPIKEYDFYIALRCVVFLASLFLLIKGVNGRSSYFWAFILIGILFNPIMPSHINKLTWAFFDIAAAGSSFPSYEIICVDQR
jgi:hypothetical protein